MNKAGSLFTPKALFAQEGGFFGIGGLPDGWSPFIPRQIVGSGIVLAYVQQPTNENVNSDILPTVTVSTKESAAPDALPLPGLTVTI